MELAKTGCDCKISHRHGLPEAVAPATISISAWARKFDSAHTSTAYVGMTVLIVMNTAIEAAVEDTVVITNDIIMIINTWYNCHRQRSHSRHGFVNSHVLFCHMRESDKGQQEHRRSGTS